MPIIAISLFNEIGGRRLMSPRVLFEAVWLELAKVVEGFGRSPLQLLEAPGSGACFFGLWPGFGT